MVFIKTLTGRTIVLTVTPHDTVAMVKRKIARQEGIPEERQRLIFVGEQLNDHHRLLDYRIEHESAVHLVVRSGDGYQVYVRFVSGRSIVFEMQPNDTVMSLKVRIREREGIPIDLQELFLEERKLEDDSTMQECGVTTNTTLNLVVDHNRNTQVFIALHTGDTMPMWVNTDETVLQLKELIAAKEGIESDLQDIYFARERLVNERTLRSYTIEDNHILHLAVITRPVLQLFVRMQSGKELTLEEPDNQTVEAVKTTRLHAYCKLQPSHSHFASNAYANSCLIIFSLANKFKVTFWSFSRRAIWLMGHYNDNFCDKHLCMWEEVGDSCVQTGCFPFRFL